MKNQERALVVAENLKHRYGFSKEYEATINGVIGPVTFKPLKIDEKSFSLGVWKDKHLTYLFFCKEVNAFIDGPKEGTIVHKVIAGHNGPRSQAIHYRNNIIISSDPKASKMLPVFTLNQLIGSFGQVKELCPFDPHPPQKDILLKLSFIGKTNEVKVKPYIV